MRSHCTVSNIRRRGFVLVAAIVALVLIALLISGAFFASGQDLAVQAVAAAAGEPPGEDVPQ